MTATRENLLHLRTTRVIRLSHMTLLSWHHAVLIPVGLTGNYLNIAEGETKVSEEIPDVYFVCNFLC